eukprot:3133306-Ditylum_brightwellii.AAC.1
MAKHTFVMPVQHLVKNHHLEQNHMAYCLCYALYVNEWNSKIENKMYTAMYLDNEGVIERVAKQQTYPFDYSFHTIDPDWDIIAQIFKILDLMNINAEFQHMKGH